MNRLRYGSLLVALIAGGLTSAGARPDGRRVLRPHAHPHADHRRSGRQLRQQRAARRPPSRQAHPGQSDDRRGADGRRVRPRGGQLSLQRGAEGRLGDRGRAAEPADGPGDRRDRRAIRRGALQLDRQPDPARRRADRLARDRRAQHGGRQEERGRHRRDQRDRHELHLSEAHQRAARHQIQDRDRLSGRHPDQARARARRGRGPRLQSVERLEGLPVRTGSATRRSSRSCR